MMQALLLATAIMTGAEAAFGRNFAGTAAYPQTFVDEFNPLKYTGSIGPYTQRPGVGISPDVPSGCEVDQVVLFARHGARYPSPDAVDAQKKVLSKIQKAAPKSGLVGSLSFLNNYEYFLSDEGYANLEVTRGPYSGLAGSFQFGAEFAGKYGDLWNQEVVPIFSDNSQRGLESARAFGQGMLGFNYSKSASINTYELDSCDDAKKLTQCSVESRNSTGIPSNSFRYPAFEIAALRLNEENGLKLTVDDVFTLFELASYEISATGSSHFVKVFTADEWIAFQYSYDAYYDCYFGSQSPRAKAAGAQFVNATVELLKKGPEDALPLALVFGDAAELSEILAALDLATPTSDLDPETISFNNNYHISDVAPMGARFVMERLSCKAPGLTNDTNLVTLTNSTKPLWGTNWTQSVNCTDLYPNATFSNSSSSNSSSSGNSTTTTTFVRFVLNDAVVPWEQCYDGPGFSCSLANFVEIAEDKVKDADFRKVCGADPKPLTFLSDYNQTTSANFDENTVPYQGGSN